MTKEFFINEGADGLFIPEFDPDYFLEPEPQIDKQILPEGIDERELRENIIRRKSSRNLNAQIEGEPVVTKIPLHKRHEQKSKTGSPLARWMGAVLKGTKSVDDPLEYTKEELDQILDNETE